MNSKSWAVSAFLFLFIFIFTQSSPTRAGEPYDMGSPVFTNLYVSPNGNDNNNGLSTTAPLQTIRGAWNKIKAQGFQQTGYKVNFLPGSYFSDIYLDDVHATYEHPIFFTASNGSGTVTFNGNIQFARVSYVYMSSITLRHAGDVFHCDTCDHFLLKNMIVDGGNRQAQETVKVNQSQHIYIEDSDIQGAYDNPIDFVAVQYGHLLNNKVHNGEDWCAYAKGGSAYITVEGNEFYNCGTGGYTTGQGTGFEYMVYPWLNYETYDTKVINNIVHDVQGAAFGVNGGFNILIAHNTAYRVGSRSHVLEVVFGSQECDGDTSWPGACQNNYNLGGWGDASGRVFSIPNKNVYVYNNIIYNPPGFQSQWQHLQIDGARSSTGGNLPSTVRADDNLQIRGNIIWNGSSNMELGVGGQACGDSNPTCNRAQILAENDINTVQPQLISPSTGNFRPVPGGNVFGNLGYDIPNFSAAESPPIAIPLGNVVNDVLFDRDQNSRNSSFVPGAYGTGTPAAPSAEVSLSITDSPDPAMAGQDVTYTITVSNSGSTAENLVVSGNLNGGTVLSANSAAANCAINATGYSCNLGSFGSGPASISVVGQSTNSGNLILTAAANTTTPDSNTTNNSASQSTTVTGDQDGDGVLDANDNCPAISNANQADNDGDRSGDVCDPDDDNDGVADTADNCPFAVNANQADLDGDQLGDSCDNDQDGDGISNASDNCSRLSNADQADADGDGVGSACDNCPSMSNANQADSNGNGVGDVCEPAVIDLVASAWATQPSQTCTGSGSSLSCTVTGSLAVRYAGNTALRTAFTMRYYLSSDGVVDTSDFLLREKSSGTFSKNQTKNIAFTRTLPRGQSAAGKKVIGVIDATNIIAESNETNNQLPSNTIGGTPPPPPSTYTVGGRAADTSGVAVGGVNLNFSIVSGTGALPGATTTDASGNWSATGFVSGVTYRVSATLANYTFTPATLDFTAASTSLNFTAAALPPPPPPSNALVPTINQAMKDRLRALLAQGANLGNRPGVFAKVGDSITSSGSFLEDMGCLDDFPMGNYTALTSTLQYFKQISFPANYSAAWCGIANSFSRSSGVAEMGARANWALAAQSCGIPNGTMLTCELNKIKPAFAMIMYGTNDLDSYNDVAQFRSYMAQVIEKTIAAGVIPVLSTIPPRLDSATFDARVAPHNNVINELAATYQIPVMNYWQALQDLGSQYHYGVDGDGIHPNVFGGQYGADFSDNALHYGYNVRNLLTLQTLEKLQRVVINDGAADAQ